MFQNTLNFMPQKGYTIKAVQISTSFNLFCEDKDFKNDPDIKQFMKEINSDFKVDTRTKSEFTTNYNEDEPSNDIKKEAISQKNISQLLSEIYGDTTSDREDTSTSIGEVFLNIKYKELNNVNFYKVATRSMWTVIVK